MKRIFVKESEELANEFIPEFSSIHEWINHTINSLEEENEMSINAATQFDFETHVAGNISVYSRYFANNSNN
ncbi:hypothetical protein GMD78_00200 [Ornithinibacillus sp. L9]|uniref:Uncharacterized protein n=1 Tax=Ornithinibacillus caprae TaxID=2678566 RepID=A0A6N8FF25_9BACI|nr:hypothetical protein [Ornithinibacillus caprae]MUK86824.1 hypothetical protein [Ornithinibacillus caprae]